MLMLSHSDRIFLATVSRLTYCNPFLPERVELERKALGKDFVEGEPVWALQVSDPSQPRVNGWKIQEKLEPMVQRTKEGLKAGKRVSDRDIRLYRDGWLYWLYYRYTRRFTEAASRQEGNWFGPGRWEFYRAFRDDLVSGFEAAGRRPDRAHAPAHLFACFHQIQRAFDRIFRHIIGSSAAAARLRAAVWESIFTHDMHRFRYLLYQRMGEFATLITGPSGTGKEVVARAVSFSRYVPFDESKRSFQAAPERFFHPINLAELSPTLIESELFGHRRGSFTGAIEDRRGRLVLCPPYGTVFLDEIGDLDPAIQVKLLRVIETRTFTPVGEADPRRFEGKLIAATNRDLSQAILRREFREDLYYRLCSDRIEMPPLAEQLSESPQVLEEVVLFMARRALGDGAESLAREAVSWVRANLADHPWPGNYRELEQCVRNILIRGRYEPMGASTDPEKDWLRDAAGGVLSCEELLRHYCRWVYGQIGNYSETARRVGLDRRTVRSKIVGEGKG